MHPEVSKARARLAAFSRADAGDDAKRAEAKRDLHAAKLQDYIERTLAAAPPLSDEQRTRLAELLRPARAKADAERNAKIVADLTQAEATVYLDMIEAGQMAPAAAWAAYREDTRKERERAEQDRQARSDLYSGMAQALSTIGVYGQYDDIPALMSNYDPAELHPPMLARYFDLENLEAALNLVTELIKWSGAK